MVCAKTCKTICIISYIIAALGAILCSWNHLLPDKKINIPKPLSILYLIGGLMTLACGIRWALNAEGKSVI